MKTTAFQLLHPAGPAGGTGTVTVGRNAMATRFEILLCGEEPVRLRAAGEEALAEIERIESRISYYLPDSEITRLNNGAARAPVRLSLVDRHHALAQGASVLPNA